MKLSKILSSKFSANEKIKEVAKTVAKARAVYGNEDLTVPTVTVQTCEGLQDLAMVSPKAKLKMVRQEISDIMNTAHKFSKEVEGGSIDRKVEELIATSPLLCNIETATTSKYI